MSSRFLIMGFSLLVMCCALCVARADGKLVRPRDYHGSLEESGQEAIIVFQDGDDSHRAVQDLILKISVTGAAREFAWIIPLPNVPTTTAESPALFAELFAYCEQRIASAKRGTESKAESGKTLVPSLGVEVLRTEIVGDFQIATVAENRAGALNEWLVANGYQSLGDAEDVLKFYREKHWVYACIRVSDAALKGARPVDLRPLRLRFEPGGRDGMVFPMKLTGLQTDPFSVNLYVFYKAWINDDLNEFGFRRRGFTLRFRDFDGPNCVANAGKLYSRPADDPYLAPYASRLTETAKFFATHYAGQRFYLNNIGVARAEPRVMRAWPDELWLFPYYTVDGFTPYDARPGGPAERVNETGFDDARFGPMTWFIASAVTMFAILGAAYYIFTRPPQRFAKPHTDVSHVVPTLDDVPPTATG